MQPIKAQGGFTLLEVLVAAIVLAIGLIGIAALQVTSTRYAESASQQGHAATLARELVERIRLNLDEGRTGNYDFSSLPSNSVDCDGAAKNCSPSQMRQHDLRVWVARVNSLLPGAAASVTTTAPVSDLDPAQITITIAWDNSRGRQVSANCLGGKPACDSYSYTLMGLELSESL